MGKPIRNPFYFVLLFACLMLVMTMFVYLIGFFYVPDPDGQALPGEMPPLLKWVDRNALYLIAGEVVVIILLSILTIGLDKYFDPAPPERRSSLPGTDDEE